jgi:hypothetical protein
LVKKKRKQKKRKNKLALKIRRHVFKPRGAELDKLRRGFSKFKHRTQGEYRLDVFHKFKKNGKTHYKKIKPEQFRSGKSYDIYVVHMGTRRRRLLSSGVQSDLPIINKTLTQNVFKPVLLGGRKFKPLKIPRKGIGKWKPIYQFYKEVERDFNQLKRERPDISKRGAIFPTKRFYHTEYKIFSDTPLKKTDWILYGFVNATVQFVYPGSAWFGSRHIPIDLSGKGEAIQIQDFPNHLSELEQTLGVTLRENFPKTDTADVIQVNGIIPTQVISNEEYMQSNKRRK